jgi:hypothetical protein
MCDPKAITILTQSKHSDIWMNTKLPKKCSPPPLDISMLKGLVKYLTMVSLNMPWKFLYSLKKIFLFSSFRSSWKIKQSRNIYEIRHFTWFSLCTELCLQRCPKRATSLCTQQSLPLRDSTWGECEWVLREHIL